MIYCTVGIGNLPNNNLGWRAANIISGSGIAIPYVVRIKRMFGDFNWVYEPQ